MGAGARCAGPLPSLAGAVATALILLAIEGAPAAAQASSTQCARCHSSREFLAGKSDSPAADEALFVPDSLLHDSKHATLSCADCHVDYDESYPHQPSASTVGCASCHRPEEAEWARSVHATNIAREGDGPACITCHNSHRVLGVQDRRSPTHPLNEAQLCGECHGDRRILETYFADPADSVARTAVERFHETVHGLALREGGLVVTATCSSCHHPHRVLPSDSAASRIARDSIPATCGTCHLGVLESYRESAHGAALEAGAENDEGHGAPVCNDCHSSHKIVAPDASWRRDVVEECGACHERLFETYLYTYHGKVTRLGSTLAAKCSDCHTPHANLPPTEVASSVHPTNLVTTCGQCHERANAQFVQYLPHAQHTDRENYPQLYWPWLFMTSLLVGVFGFFGLHTGLWLMRSLIAKAAEPNQVHTAAALPREPAAAEPMPRAADANSAETESAAPEPPRAPEEQ